MTSPLLTAAPPPAAPSTMDIVVQCDLQTACHNTQCVQDKNLITSLKTTIEVMEAEIKCLKDEVKICKERYEANLSSSKVIVSTLPHRHDLAADHPVNRHTRRVNGFIEELRAKHKNLEVVDFNHISRRLFTSHGMIFWIPGKRLFDKLIIEALLRINILVCDPSSAIMVSPADKPPSTNGPVIAAELHRGAKSSSDATGPSDDTEPVAAAGPQHDAGSLLLLAILLQLNLVMILPCLLNSI
ncbi:hypothetical protein J6590_054941 [Homalodisca vitripennis]|nr:hypothetical protein J6590_054941 [Homalodisca vitripennis]